MGIPQLTELKKRYFTSVRDHTPENIQKKPIISLSIKGEIKLSLNKKNLREWQLKEWLARYKKEALVSTGGIRGAQNVLFYWDCRFPIHQLGVALATAGKAEVLKKRIKDHAIHKIAGREVRYNSAEYVELIARIQAGQGIHTHLAKLIGTMPVWMASFLIFILDYDGGEYVTSSHAASSKIATKDLSELGSQFLLEDSLAFVYEIEKILRKAEQSKDGYTISLSPKNSPYIHYDVDGIKLYTAYLRTTVALAATIALIKKARKKKFRIMFEVVGGCMYNTVSQLYNALGIETIVDWRHKKEDPFFHGVGKVLRFDAHSKKQEFFDLSCDACLPEVVQTMGFDRALARKPIGYTVLITDPDGDRLVMGQVESKMREARLRNLGVVVIPINSSKVFALYHPTHSFLALMDFHKITLKKAGLWDKHPRVLITTTPSSRAWVEWAKQNGLSVVLTPVGFKELALIMRKIERQLTRNPEKEVVVLDIFGEKINLGKNPRLFFAGEESGGMVTGPEELIKSRAGRIAISMHEKSAGEMSVTAIALAAHLFLEKKFFSEYIEEIYSEYGIQHRFYARDDITYYNESEPDPIILQKEKTKGEVARDKTDLFYLSIAIAKIEGIVDIEKARRIFGAVFPKLDFSFLRDVIFVGDATLILFEDMFVEIRKSGTDAKMRGYASGSDNARVKNFLHEFLHYNGAIFPLYKKFISEQFRKQAPQKARDFYDAYLSDELGK